MKIKEHILVNLSPTYIGVLAAYGPVERSILKRRIIPFFDVYDIAGKVIDHDRLCHLYNHRDNEVYQEAINVVLKLYHAMPLVGSEKCVINIGITQPDEGNEVVKRIRKEVGSQVQITGLQFCYSWEHYRKFMGQILAPAVRGVLDGRVFEQRLRKSYLGYYETIKTSQSLLRMVYDEVITYNPENRDALVSILENF